MSSKKGFCGCLNICDGFNGDLIWVLIILFILFVCFCGGEECSHHHHHDC